MGPESLREEVARQLHEMNIPDAELWATKAVRAQRGRADDSARLNDAVAWVLAKQTDAEVRVCPRSQSRWPVGGRMEQ